MAVLYNIKVDDLSIEQIKDEVSKTIEKLMSKS
jgi:hypothetical protein